MGRIRVLSDQIVNRIAAGEVVERPASVVKELVENSLDAGSSSVEIVVESGGKRRIRVRDDGCGMDRDDALLALERHATSKLSEAGDLEAISTLGFRGEALPSISAVSRLLLRSAVRDGQGSEIEVRAGRIVSVREAGLPRGTSIDVQSLFFNVPARRKFLRSEATEISHVLRWATRYALAWPGVRFSLRHGESHLLDLPGTASLEGRAARLFGPDAARRLVPFSLEREGARVHGLAGRPADAQPRRGAQHLFVNGRVVQDRVLSHAVAEAYANTVAGGRFPTVVLFLEIDPGGVDVNVHPQKLEVRFSRSSWVHDLVRDSLASTLSGRRAVPRLEDLRPSGSERVAEGAPASRDRGETPPAPPAAAWSAPGVEPEIRAIDLGDGREGEAGGLSFRRDERAAPVPLAQFRGAYILADDGEAVVVVDQHAAHERILFERFLRQVEEGAAETQALLFPLAVELLPHELAVVEEEIEEFRRLGFRLEAFGGNTVRLDAVPSLAAGVDAAALFRELVGEAGRSRSAASSVGSLRRRLVTTAACRAAVKASDPLSRGEMAALLESLFSTSSPTTCPHGRPVLFRLSFDEIERAFRRR